MSGDNCSAMWCTACGKPIGYFSNEEILAMEGFDWFNVLCFECDKDSAETVPSIFWQWQAGDQFKIGDYWFIVSSDRKDLLAWTSELYMYAIARAHACLSSSTYLNSNNKNQGPGRACFVCEDGKKIRIFGGLQCSDCGTFLPDDQTITIPLWILGSSFPGSEND